MEEKIIQELEAIKRYTLLGSKNVLTLDDVALLTGLSKSHLYKLTASKTIPFYKQNGMCFSFDKSDVEAWMKQHRVTSIAEAEQEAVAYLVTGKKGGTK